MSRHSRSFFGIFGAPLVIGIIGLTGLILALLVDDKTEIFAGLAVSLPIAAILWAYRSRF